jgi:hypothetical protein
LAEDEVFDVVEEAASGACAVGEASKGLGTGVGPAGGGACVFSERTG